MSITIDRSELANLIRQGYTSFQIYAYYKAFGLTSAQVKDNMKKRGVEFTQRLIENRKGARRVT